MDMKEAIEILNKKLSIYFNMLCRKFPPSEVIEFKQALQTAIDLMERYESIQRWPKEKKKLCTGSLHFDDCICDEIEVYNEGIKDSKLALLRKQDEIRDILQIRYFKLMSPNITESDAKIVEDVLSKAIIQTIIE